MTDFKTMLRKAGFVTSNGMLDRKAAIEYLDASERTLERWINTNKPCKRALKLLDQKIAGGIIQAGRWKGFYICAEGFLWTPNGRKFEPNYLERVWILQQSTRFKDSTIVNLRAEIEHLKSLVNSRERIKEMGEELIDISANWSDYVIDQLQKQMVDDAKELENITPLKKAQ
ncbi:MAG: hypothetical protein CMK63_03870 [Pseudoalteromonadaceae bacterium]|jgi:hypothetical protein|nr:hypothetical protein [Pseudoalteromonadaceae bacterium]|tara:strand:- start:661 stop:1176 length:516 start_codon:yes stop_codon:yes gene_type:complete